MENVSCSKRKLSAPQDLLCILPISYQAHALRYKLRNHLYMLYITCTSLVHVVVVLTSPLYARSEPAGATVQLQSDYERLAHTRDHVLDTRTSNSRSLQLFLIIGVIQPTRTISAALCVSLKGSYLST